MKILRIIARLNVGGPARHVVWLSEGLKSYGFETVLVAGVVPPGEDDMSYIATQAGIEPVTIPQMSREISLKDALTVWKLFRLMVREQPSLVHTHTAKAGTVGRVAGMMYRWLTPATLVGKPRACRFVHTYHGHVFHSYYGRRKTRLFLAIERWLACLATDRIVVISEQQRQEINEHFRVGRREQFAVIPLGIDLRIYNEWRQRRSRLRDEIGAGPDDVLIGIVGRLTEVKNHKLFLAAAALLRSSRRVRFVIVGDGHLRTQLEQQVDVLGLKDRVRFIGTRNDPENFYSALDILALTSLNEGTPLSLIEAMANSRPVIATSVGGVVDLLGPDTKRSTNAAFRICERGLAVRSGDAEGLACGLEFLISSDDVCRELGQHGREFVMRNYTKERLLADISQLYAQLLRVDSLPAHEAALDSVSATQDHYHARLTPRS